QRVLPRLGRDRVGRRGAGQAAALDRVPAVAAGVLPAVQAEVEGSVERLERVTRRALLLLGAGDRERLLERRAGVADEMAQAATERADGAQRAALALDGLERVARATPFTEGFGQDFGHRLPGSISKTRRLP